MAANAKRYKGHVKLLAKDPAYKGLTTEPVVTANFLRHLPVHLGGPEYAEQAEEKRWALDLVIRKLEIKESKATVASAHMANTTAVAPATTAAPESDPRLAAIIKTVMATLMLENGTGRPVRKCWYCDKQGHLKKDCPRKLKDEAAGKDVSPKDNTPGGNYSGAKVCLSMSVLCAPTTTDRKTVLLDGGANVHLTADASLFSTPLRSCNISVKVASDGFITATQQGDVLFDVCDTAGNLQRLHLRDVLYIPTAVQRTLVAPALLVADYTYQIAGSAPDGSAEHRLIPVDGRPVIVARTDTNLGLLDGVRAPPGLPAPAMSLALSRVFSPADVALKVKMHCALGHPPDDVLRELVTKDLVTGVPKGSWIGAPLPDCVACRLGKTKRAPFSGHLHRATVRFGRLSGDIWGPAQITGHGGIRYFMVLADDATSKVFTLLLRTRSDAHDELQAWLKVMHNKIPERLKIFRSDNAPELSSAEFEAGLRSLGVEPEHTPPHSSERNGLAERMIGVLNGDGRVLRADARDLPPSLWPYALAYATLVRNRRFTRGRSNLSVTPEQAWSGQVPDMTHFHRWGCHMSVLLPDSQREHGKLGPTAEILRFIGLIETGNGFESYQLYDPVTRSVKERRSSDCKVLDLSMAIPSLGTIAGPQPTSDGGASTSGGPFVADVFPDDEEVDAALPPTATLNPDLPIPTPVTADQGAPDPGAGLPSPPRSPALAPELSDVPQFDDLHSAASQGVAEGWLDAESPPPQLATINDNLVDPETPHLPDERAAPPPLPPSPSPSAPGPSELPVPATPVDKKAAKNKGKGQAAAQGVDLTKQRVPVLLNHLKHELIAQIPTSSRPVSSLQTAPGRAPPERSEVPTLPAATRSGRQPMARVPFIAGGSDADNSENVVWMRENVNRERINPGFGYGIAPPTGETPAGGDPDSPGRSSDNGSEANLAAHLAPGPYGTQVPITPEDEPPKRTVFVAIHSPQTATRVNLSRVAAAHRSHRAPRTPARRTQRHSAIPRSVKEALSIPQWLAAIKKEMVGIEENGTWSDIEHADLPPGTEPIPTQMVLDMKRSAYGDEEPKARLVVMGNRQRPGRDFDDTWATTINIVTTRTLLAMANQFDWEIHVLDVRQAFLKAKIDRDVYLRLPRHLCTPGSSGLKKLHKSLYGLKQAGHLWQQLLVSELTKLGYKTCPADDCLFYRFSGDDLVFVGTFVDDLPVVGTSLAAVAQAKAEIKGLWAVKDKGEMTEFIGMAVRRHRTHGILTIDLGDYARGVLARYADYGLSPEQLSPAPIPVAVDHNSIPGPVDDAEREAMERRPFKEVVGMFQYMVERCRPDLAPFTSFVSRHVAHPSKGLWGFLVQGCRYLVGTLDYGLVFRRTSEGSAVQITTMSDSDWASDKENRHSTFGYVTKIGDSTVDWKTAKGKQVSTSSMEAEYVALYHGVTISVWLHGLLRSMRLPGYQDDQPPTPLVYCDNQAALKLADHPTSFQRSKHIDVKYHYSRECIANGLVRVQYCPTRDMTADILTKMLPRPAFEKHRPALGVNDVLMAMDATVRGRVSG